MKPRKFTRRQLLAGAAGAGGVGAAIGTGTVALLSDESVFIGSEFVVGELDLLVEWDDDGNTKNSEDGTASLVIDEGEGEVTFSVALPGERNNPAYGWLRITCPSEAPALAYDLDVTLSYVDCNGTDPSDPIAEGSLLEVANELRNGIPLDSSCNPNAAPENRDCLSSSDPTKLRLEWELQEPYDGDPAPLVDFKFVGRQCRHNDGTENPFGTFDECIPVVDGKGISYVAWCSDVDEPINPRITDLKGINDDGEPVIVDWKTDVNVGYVIVFYANQMTIYDYRDPQKTTGTVRTNDPDAAVQSYDVSPGEASTPCEVADRLLDDSDSFTVKRSAKLEYENNTWEEG